MESGMQYLQIKVFGYWKKNRYTSNVESVLTRKEIKHWVEFFFGVKVITMNSQFRKRLEECDPFWDRQCITNI